MKHVEIIAQPQDVDEIVSALSAIIPDSILVSSAKQLAPTIYGSYRGQKYEIRYEARSKIEMWTTEKGAFDAVEVMLQINSLKPEAKTRISVLPTEELLVSPMETRDHEAQIPAKSVVQS
ncbi:MAG TPA: hypothetical protein VIM69_06055 [Opitutaceae bacterium]